MGRVIGFRVTLLTIAILIGGCRDNAKEANTSDSKSVKVDEATSISYKLDVLESQMEWKGFKPTRTHNGIIALKEGSLFTNNNKLVGGTALIDMSSIQVLDLEGKSKANLENHLKGTVPGKEGDFFNVTKFPEAKFEITNVTSNENGTYNLSGNLSIKDIQNNITFPVKVTDEDSTLMIQSEPFTIDRTKWEINFKSKSVFDNLGDSFINDEIELKIRLKAHKE